MGNRIQCQISPGYEALQDWIMNLPASFDLGGSTVYKDRNEVKCFEVQGFRLNVKAFKVPNKVNRFAYVYLRGSKAARSFRNARIIQDLGGTTPGPVGYLECIRNGLLAESYYVSHQYDYDFTLRDVLLYRIPDRDNILEQWVEYTWEYLHRKGIYHLDYSPGNTLIRKEGDKLRFAVVDLNRMKFLPFSFEKGLHNFRLLDTDEETLRIIAGKYAGLCGEPPGKAFEILLKYARSSQNFRQRKNNFNRKLRKLRGKV